jgi:predicted CxxxxCH...CXXCH cytochrome family protein
MVGGLATFPSCSCHDATTPGGTFAVGVKPLCSACHKALDATDPTKLHLNTNPGCGDCHGDKALNSARPVGAAFPDRKFAHDKHIFAGVGCSVCHNTYGTGSASHGYSTNNPNPVVANVAIAPEYKAETPAAAPVGVVNGYNPATRMCSNVSCHGGKAPQNINNQTPDWRAGAAGLLTDCFNCHDKATNPIPAIGTAYAPTTITPQYNSFWSGDGRVQGHTFGNSLHALHLGMGNGAELDFRNFGLISCTDCHDSTELAKVHFGGLNTTQMVGAETTILPTMNYNAGNSWGCAAAAGCHTIPSVFRWK